MLMWGICSGLHRGYIHEECKKNVILTDVELGENCPFIKALSETTEMNWELLVCDQRRNNVKRLIMYVIFPFLLFLRRIQFDHVIAWQQFYGLLLVFYARVFHVKKHSIWQLQNVENNDFYVQNCIGYRDQLTTVHTAEKMIEIYKYKM
jgi:hypothetical protein